MGNKVIRGTGSVKTDLGKITKLERDLLIDALEVYKEQHFPVDGVKVDELILRANGHVGPFSRCETCSGVGSVGQDPGIHGPIVTCPTCQGTGCDSGNSNK